MILCLKYVWWDNQTDNLPVLKMESDNSYSYLQNNDNRESNYPWNFSFDAMSSSQNLEKQYLNTDSVSRGISVAESALLGAALNWSGLLRNSEAIFLVGSLEGNDGLNDRIPHAVSDAVAGYYIGEISTSFAEWTALNAAFLPSASFGAEVSLGLAVSTGFLVEVGAILVLSQVYMETKEFIIQSDLENAYIYVERNIKDLYSRQIGVMGYQNYW